MNHRMMLRLVCYILRVEALAMLPGALISLYRREWDAVLGLCVAIVLAALLSLSTFLAPPKDREIGAQEGFISVAYCWIAVSLVGALPFFISGAIPGFIDCWFETVSGFTTTGASILTDIEALPMGLLYWRSFTHWLGGMGVLVFLLAVVPMGKGKNTLLHVMQAESPGPQVDKLVPQLQSTARILYSIYVALTFLQVILLLLGGMPVFDSFCIAFGTAGTGGFGVRNDSLAGYSPYLQGVCTVFMALFGVNFNVFYLLLLRRFARVLFNEELRLYVLVMLISTGLIAWNTVSQFSGSWGSALHHAAFQVSSIMTTTGYSTVDFNLWSAFSKTLLLALMVLGACAGSTGGGIKMARVLLMFKSGKRAVKRMLLPRSVSVIHMDGQRVNEETVWNTHSYITLYCLTIILSTVLISFDEFSVETNISAVLACLNNIGPGLDMVGPMGNYAQFSWFSKLVLSINMLAGRLELFPLLMLIVPAAWRKQ